MKLKKLIILIITILIIINIMPKEKVMMTLMKWQENI